MSEPIDVLVIGAGIIGLTTAIRLCEAGATTRVVTADAPAETTSVLATAMVGPTFGFSGPRVSEWEAKTLDAFAQEPLLAGVHRCRGRFLSPFAGLIPPGADALAGFEPCTRDDLPAGYGGGFWAEVPLVDMPPYVADLAARYLNLGGTIERATFGSLTEALSLAPLVANCAGLGASALVPDPDVEPLRGPKIVVENPGIATFAIVGPPGPELTAYHPHGDVVVLGGSATPSADTRADPDEEAAIIERCAAIEPRLRQARVLEHRVGLRPGRPQIRLDTEQRDATRVVHNYGHGGLGVTVCWGCAAEATSLLLT